jgi:hypothetical protein
MSKRDNGGPAFPRPVSDDRTQGDQPDGNRTIRDQEGMTLRDWFAGQTLPPCTWGVPRRWIDRLKAFFGFDHAGTEIKPETAAKMAYRIADAMLAERAK